VVVLEGDHGRGIYPRGICLSSLKPGILLLCISSPVGSGTTAPVNADFGAF